MAAPKPARNHIKVYGPRLRLVMELRGIARSVLAEEVGVTGSAVANWILGRAMPNAGTMALICVKLKVSADYLLGLGGGLPEDLAQMLRTKIPRKPAPEKPERLRPDTATPGTRKKLSELLDKISKSELS